MLTRIISGHEAALRRELSAMPTEDASPFGAPPGTHAATFSEIAHESRAAAKDGHGSGLLFTIYGDAPSAAQLERLVAVLPEMSSIWRHCADSPDDAKHLLPYLDSLPSPHDDVQRVRLRHRAPDSRCASATGAAPEPVDRRNVRPAARSVPSRRLVLKSL